MTAYHRRTLTNRMLGRRRPVSATSHSPMGNLYTVPLLTQNTVTVTLNSTRKKSSNRSLTSSNRLKSSNTSSSLRDLERERKMELCKLLQTLEAPFDRNDGRTMVILRAIRFLTQAIEHKYPAKMYNKPHLYYKQLSDYIINTVFDQGEEIDVKYLKDLATDLGLYKKCRLTR
jgi:hypothetical protein